MDYNWIDRYCLAKQGASKDFKEEWNATRYLLGGKMFGMQGGDKERKPIITLKLKPANGLLLRQQYPGIIPGYYMNKEHWNSVYLNGTVPDDVLQQMVDESYQLILESLPKKTQRQIQQPAEP